MKRWIPLAISQKYVISIVSVAKLKNYIFAFTYVLPYFMVIFAWIYIVLTAMKQWSDEVMKRWSDEAMKWGDEALNASSLQFLSSVKRFTTSSLQFFLSVKRFFAVTFCGKTLFNASSPLLFKGNSSPLFFKITLPTSGCAIIGCVWLWSFLE